MKLSMLSKEQKQYMVLGVVISIILVVSLSMFVLKPLRVKWSDARGEYKELTAQLDEANELMRGETQLRGELEEARRGTLHAMAECIPDPENSLSWVTQRVYLYARKAGVEVQSVSAGASKTRTSKRGEEQEQVFGMFSVDIMVQCNYDDLLAFVQEMESHNPYLCLSGLIIAPQRGSAETHNVSVEIQWPVWKDMETASKVRERIGGDHG